MAGTPIAQFPLHLGLGAVAVPQPAFTGIAWYQAYVERTASDGDEGRLVSFSEFAESWDSWEMHPAGDEVVLCLTGTITLHREFPDGTVDAVALRSGEYAINPPGVWHTADIEGPATALFITAGAGTEHRPR